MTDWKMSHIGSRSVAVACRISMMVGKTTNTYVKPRRVVERSTWQAVPAMCFAERSGFGLNALLGLRLTDASLLKKCRKLLRLDLVADAIQVLAAIFRAKGEDPVLHAAQASSSEIGRATCRERVWQYV